MNVHLATLGCRLNEAELAGMARQLAAAGHVVVAAAEHAEVVVVNSCAVTGEAARKSRKLVAGLHRRNPAARLIVTGCYAELAPAVVARQPGVDLVVGNRGKDGLVAALGRVAAVAPSSAPRGRTRAFVKVQDGCRNHCTYCVVTVARGAERSRSIAEVVAEIAELEAAGHREVVLCGVHLGGYGAELGCDLFALVDRVLRDTRVPRLRLSSLEPWDLPPHFAELWQDRRLMPHLHLPLQAGSDAVLRRMARRCSTAAYARLAERLRAAIPDLSLTSDVIVGFPGESDAEWQETMAFVRAIGFADLHVFGFSPREGTRAARLPGPVAAEIKRARSRELHALAAAQRRAHLERFVGSRRAVLWEAGGGAGRRVTGYTDNYLPVETVAPRGVDLSHRIEAVDLAELDPEGDGFLVAAGLGAATLAPPDRVRRRISLPVVDQPE